MTLKLGDLLHRLRGFSTPLGGVSWNPPPREREIAQRLMVFLYDLRVLHVPSEAEIPNHAVEAVLQIRRELTNLSQNLGPQSELELKIRAMRGACLHFLNRIQRDEEIVRYGNQPGHRASWEFIDSLGQWRAFMAVYIGIIAASYEVEPPLFIIQLLPHLPAEDKITNQSGTSDRISDLINQFAELPAERQRGDIDATNRYLASAEGQREFAHLHAGEAAPSDRGPEQGSPQ